MPIIYDISKIPSVDSDWEGKLESTLKCWRELWSGNSKNSALAGSLEGNADIETIEPLMRGGPSYRKIDEESSGHIGHIVFLLRNLHWPPAVCRSYPALLAWPARSCKFWCQHSSQLSFLYFTHLIAQTYDAIRNSFYNPFAFLHIFPFLQ